MDSQPPTKKPRHPRRKPSNESLLARIGPTASTSAKSRPAPPGASKPRLASGAPPRQQAARPPPPTAAKAGPLPSVASGSNPPDKPARSQRPRVRTRPGPGRDAKSASDAPPLPSSSRPKPPSVARTSATKPPPTQAVKAKKPPTPAQEAKKFETKEEKKARALLAAAKSVQGNALDLETSRVAYEGAKVGGGAAFLALDVETYEWRHELILEVGWSSVHWTKNGEEVRTDRHAIIQENSHKRNGKFSPDARDHFDFGRSTFIPSSNLTSLLSTIFNSLSTYGPLFLIFHDSRSDIKSLAELGLEPNKFSPHITPLKSSGVHICDTQKLWSGWTGNKMQTKLGFCCEVLNVPTRRLHNAGNDAHYTLDVFERLMDRSRIPPPPPPPPAPREGEVVPLIAAVIV